MAVKTNQSTNNTSFHGVTFRASVNQITSAFGEPTIHDNTGEDKTNFEWEMETNEGKVFTIYDWKEYRKLDLNEKIVWHIGAKTHITCAIARSEIFQKL
jgi:hypothetical protein